MSNKDLEVDTSYLADHSADDEFNEFKRAVMSSKGVYKYTPLTLINPSFKQLIEYQKQSRPFFVLVTHNLDCCVNFTHIKCQNMFVFYSREMITNDKFIEMIEYEFIPDDWS